MMKMSFIFGLRAWKWFLFKRAVWLLCPILYLMNLKSVTWLEFAGLVFVLFFYFFSGVTLNDWLNKTEDEAAGKKTGSENLGKAGAAGVVTLTALAASGLAYYLGGLYAALLPLGLVLEGSYAAFFKGRGFLGVLLNSLAELSPFLFVLGFFGHWETDGIVFALCYFMVCMTDILNHQLEDLENDRKSGTKTWSVSLGKEKTGKVLGILSLLATYAFLVLSILLLQLEYFEYFLLLLVLLRLVHPHVNPGIREFFAVRLFYVDFVLIGFLSLLPLYLTVLLLLKSWLYLPVLVFVLIADLEFLKTLSRRLK